MRKAAAALVLLVLAVSAGRAEALDDDHNQREARACFEQATRLYNIGEFDRAIAGYKRAYELSPAPGLLFNIAQAYRAKRDRENALYFYAAFLREQPDAPERQFVEARMDELRRAPPPAPDPVPDPGGELRQAGAVTAGVGAALLVTGIVFAVQAHGAFDDAAASGDPSAGKGTQTRAIIFTAGGAAAMITGTVMFYIGSHPVRVAPVFTGRAGGVTLAGRF